MGRPYIPGPESREYYRLPSAARAGVIQEVNDRFRKETGVTRQLNPTSAADLELRRTWLRIRDEVINERLDREEEELRHELDLDGLETIPDEMRWEKWKEGAILLETWFGRPPAIAPKYSAPVTDVIKMDWVLTFDRAKSVYDAIFSRKLWTSDKSQEQMRSVLKPNPSGQVQQFGDLSQPPTAIDGQWINSLPVTNGFAFDGLTAALGGFIFQVVIAGKLQWISAKEFWVTVEEVGVYVKDSFDFNGDQFLGVWGYRDTPVNNSDFREWRAKNNAGGDFQVFSDIKRTKLSSADLVKVAVK